LVGAWIIDLRHRSWLSAKVALIGIDRSLDAVFVGAFAEVQRVSIGKAILCLIILAIPTMRLSAIG
jgi:hypothetical protein